MNFRDFVAREDVRRRYWARALVGWARFRGSAPNAAHAALARIEATGRIRLLVTQNVDGLHQRAGSGRVLDLHGRLDRVVCLSCRAVTTRDDAQAALLAANPAFGRVTAAVAPDGDADLTGVDFDSFVVPPCGACGGILKPDVVFFGETVPRDRVEAAYAALRDADGVLVAGTSLSVWSGYRFVRAAADARLPIAIVNRGRTRADDLATLRIREAVGETLSDAAAALRPLTGSVGTAITGGKRDTETRP